MVRLDWANQIKLRLKLYDKNSDNKIEKVVKSNIACRDRFKAIPTSHDYKDVLE